MQFEIDFTAVVHTKENNSFSEAILFDQYERLSNQCRIVYDLLKAGYRLTVKSAMVDHGIGDLRARVRDLRRFNNVDVKDELLKGGFKEYFL